MSDVHFLVGLKDNRTADQVIGSLVQLSGAYIILERRSEFSLELLVRTSLDGFVELFGIRPVYDRRSGWEVSKELAVPDGLKAHVRYVGLNRNQPYI